MTTATRCLLAVAIAVAATCIPWPIVWTPSDLQLFEIGFVTFLAAVIAGTVALDTWWTQR